MKMPVSASITRFSTRRYESNQREASRYASMGYEVKKNMHPNGAFFASKDGKVKHDEWEKGIGEVFAENGISFTLEPDGTAKIKLKDNTTIFYPALDGKTEGFTHEIMGLRGKKADVGKIVEGIKHSRKPIRDGRSKALQADVAITYTLEGSPYHRNHMDEAAKEYKRQYSSGETLARPLIWLNVDLPKRKIYYRSIK